MPATRVDSREAFADADWQEFEAFMDGTLEELEIDRANDELAYTARTMDILVGWVELASWSEFISVVE